ncbi:MAG TPA: helix-turn-helix domain-containing protein [Anaerolineaceae bacterium]|nr:helix-turn-helix domain-containing protein [Anaerolineaceae bacterium]
MTTTIEKTTAQSAGTLQAAQDRKTGGTPGFSTCNIARNDLLEQTGSEHPSGERDHFIEPLLKAADIAKILRISKTQAYRLMGAEIPAIRFGVSCVRVKLSDLQRYIEAHREGGHG